MPRKGSKKYKHPQFTTWCFTHNNWTENDEAYYQELTFASPDRKVSSIAWAREIGEEGTPHLQGFLQLYKKSMYKCAGVAAVNAASRKSPKYTAYE